MKTQFDNYTDRANFADDKKKNATLTTLNSILANSMGESREHKKRSPSNKKPKPSKRKSPAKYKGFNIENMKNIESGPGGQDSMIGRNLIIDDDEK